MRDDDDEQLKIELLSQWKLEAEFRKKYSWNFILFERISLEILKFQKVHIMRGINIESHKGRNIQTKPNVT